MDDPLHSDPVETLITRLLPVAQEYGLTRHEVELWLPVASTYWPGNGCPLDHLDDPDWVIDVSRRQWGVVW